MKNFSNPSDNKDKANLKRPLTLDLNKPPVVKQKYNQSVTGPPVLNTPDLLLLKLGSPELASMIMSGDNLQTPTPNLFPNKITTEQEDYAKGFVDALNSLHNNNSNTENQAPTTTLAVSQSENVVISSNSISNITTTNPTMSGGGITYTNLDSDGLLQIKQEDSSVMGGGSRADSMSPEPSMEGLDPINMDQQERIKLERKRQRNRVAASKCRLRKIERISKLEDRVKILKVENSELGSVVMSLKQHVFQLKEEVISHVQSGCKINHLTNNQF